MFKILSFLTYLYIITLYSLTRWRRSIGAVFSHLWSNKEVDDSTNNNNNTMDTSDTLDVSAQIDENNEPDSRDNTDGGKKHSTPHHNRKNSSARRKHAVAHRTPSSPMIEEVETTATISDEQLDGNEKIQQINTLVENTSINDDGDDVKNNVNNISTPTLVLTTCVVSDDDCCDNEQDQEQRKNSTTESAENITTPSTPSMLKTPTSPVTATQSFRRGGKLRGSAGPVFKSIFNKNHNNSSKIQKTVSRDALNSSNFADGNNHNDKQRKRSLLSKKRNKELHKSATVIAQHSTVESSGYPMVKSLSSCTISREKDNRSVSSTETISSKCSSIKGGDIEGGDITTDNNNRFVKSKTERKSKIFKTLKSFVGKK